MFDGTSFIPAQPGSTVFDRILDYDQGNSGTFSLAEDDTLDLSALLSTAFGSGQFVSALVRVSESSSGTAAFLQIDQDGTLNGTTLTTIAQLDGVHSGDAVKVILDSSPAGTGRSPRLRRCRPQLRRRRQVRHSVAEQQWHAGGMADGRHQRLV